MQILKVVPATKIPLLNPQVLSYYSLEDVCAGAVVKVPIRNREVKAIVVESDNLEAQKTDIKSANFKLKKINKVLVNQPIYDENFFELLFWASQFWYEPVGLFVKIVLPIKLEGKIEKTATPQINQNQKKYLHIKNNKEESLERYIKLSFKEKNQLLCLFPEIDPIEIRAKKFYNKFSHIETFHGQKTNKQVSKIWNKVQAGQPIILFATKKACFLPWKKLGSIWIDEEESPHYKAWGRHPKYHGKHLAYKLAQLHQADLTLSSYAPSVESFQNFQEKNYRFLNKNKSFDKNLKRCCGLKIINRSKEFESENKGQKFSYFSAALINRLKDVGKKEKILFLHPRRGTSTFIFCTDCGYVFSCPDCNISFSFHQRLNKLYCHYCGRKENPPVVCLQCKSHRLKYGGTGTEKVLRELKKILPEFKGIRLDSDTAPDPQTKKKLIHKFKKDQLNFVLGTQMALSALFDKFNLSVILNIDLFLDQPHFKAHENTIALIKKLEAMSDSLIIQTYKKESKFLNQIKTEKYTKLYINKLQRRKKFFYPPKSQLVKITCPGKNTKHSLQKAQVVKKRLIEDKKNFKNKDIQIVGPSPTTPPKQKGKFLHQLVLKVNRKRLKQRNKLLEVVNPSCDIDVEPSEL